MPRFPLDFVQCPACTHVWNRAFHYDAIPYQNNPNRMFNTGTIWRGHLAATRDMLAARLPAAPTVVEIGCGEGHFLRGLAAICKDGRFVGFDPNTSAEAGRGIEFQARYFDPLQDMPTLAPDAIVIRHVLEHLTHPATLLQQLAWGASLLDKAVYVFIEVPCIDRALETFRLADFYYEHFSQFTSRSFRALLDTCGDWVELAHGYDGEVVYGLASLGITSTMKAQISDATAFAQRATRSQATIRAALNQLAASGKTVCIWGGTGKAAAFMNLYGVDAVRFPLVVDSDPDKVGTCVPGTGQQIVYRDVLQSIVTDVLIIPTQWRAHDIVAEMRREGITAGEILIEHEGRLVDFLKGNHPYQPASA